MVDVITKEALKWLKQNEHKGCSNSSYSSPRISSEYPDCSTPFSFDLYNFCSYGCLYCFAYFQKMNNPAVDTIDTTLKSVNVNKLIDIFEGKYPENPYYKWFISKRKIMHIGGMADNFCNFERTNKRGVILIEYLLRTGYPIIISTKGDFLTMPEYMNLFEKYKDVACCAIQSSIITDDDKVGAKIEVGVPSPTRRYENLKKVSEMGYYTILRLRPFIIGISDKKLDSLLQKMVDYKIHAISTEFYAMDMRVDDEVKKRYEWMSNICGFDIVEYYKKLSPSCPYNYFHGKIKPSGLLDDKGNIIYEYVPHAYELDWIKEGLL